MSYSIREFPKNVNNYEKDFSLPKKSFVKNRARRAFWDEQGMATAEKGPHPAARREVASNEENRVLFPHRAHRLGQDAQLPGRKDHGFGR